MNSTVRPHVGYVPQTNMTHRFLDEQLGTSSLNATAFMRSYGVSYEVLKAP
jgi:hypothetical protein